MVFDNFLGYRQTQTCSLGFIRRDVPDLFVLLEYRLLIVGRNPLSRVFSYSASKGAVHNLSKNLAREWATMNIRVNTLVPGFFPAEQNRKVLTPDRVASNMGHTPMDRFGDANELIGATLLLASEKAGSFITGHEMIVDGGYSSMTI